MTIALHTLLQTIREEKQLTLAQVAQRSHVAIEKIEAFEKGQKTPSIQTILKLAQALDTPAEHLLTSLNQKKKAYAQREK